MKLSAWREKIVRICALFLGLELCVYTYMHARMRTHTCMHTYELILGRGRVCDYIYCGI